MFSREQLLIPSIPVGGSMGPHIYPLRKGLCKSPCKEEDSSQDNSDLSPCQMCPPKTLLNINVRSLNPQLLPIYISCVSCAQTNLSELDKLTHSLYDKPTLCC